jgi:hypothetical protein
MNQYMEWWLVESILMCWSKMCWLQLSLCSTTANLPGCPKSNADQIKFTANALANNFDVAPGKDPANAAE